MRERERESNNPATHSRKIINLSALKKYAQERKKESNYYIVRAGFTIIEISITLVVIALIIGGIMLGQTLIRASEIRSIATQKEAFVSSSYTFRDKFNGIPGDIIDAQNVWGAAANCTSAQTTSATCNGTGNGLIDNFTTSSTIGVEEFLFWKHLANAGLISGQYYGVKDGANKDATTSNNAPKGKISNSLWFTQYWGRSYGNSAVFNGNYGNVLVLALPSNADPINPVITASEMLDLDTKIDDGKPGSGRLMPRRLNVGTCAVRADGVTQAYESDNATALYNTNSTGNQCALIFTNVF